MNDYKTVDEYIANFSGRQKEYLEKARQVIKQAVPDAQEKISYGIPTFSLNGKNLVHIAAYEGHYAFYPGSAPIAAFAEELKPYETSKGTVRFPLDKPAPYELIEAITRAAAEQNLRRKKWAKRVTLCRQLLLLLFC